jgi:hypothetical protein
VHFPHSGKKNRAGGSARDLFGYASHEDSLEACGCFCAHHDGVDFLFVGHLYFPVVRDFVPYHRLGLQ